MITNTPNKSDFEKVSIENLVQSFNLLFKVYDDFIDHDDEVIKEEVPLEGIWLHHHGTIKTALILLHQAIEGLMKSEICETSPLLLIDKPRKDWPTLPASEDKDFDTLYTIGGESLLTTFCAVPGKFLKNPEIITFIEEIRLKRNQAIHGTDVKDISAKYVINNVLKAFTLWYETDAWHINLKAKLIDNPLFGYFDVDYENAISYKFLDFALFLLGKSELAKYISVNIKSRPYFCPECKRGIEHDYGTMKSKWAFLNPNEPASNNLHCINCHQDFPIIRKDCHISDCKGNVLFDDPDWSGGTVCLTCYSTHEYEE